MLWHAIYGVGTDTLFLHNQFVNLFDRARKQIARNVRNRRIALELTQEQLAERAQLDLRHFQKIEAGELNLTLKTLCLLARALRTNLVDLLS
jgi:DNA-binding XRE family transcriptional regulator